MNSLNWVLIQLKYCFETMIFLKEEIDMKNLSTIYMKTLIKWYDIFTNKKISITSIYIFL